MKLYIKSALTFVFLLLLISCEEIINEINIENDTIQLVAPFDGANLSNGTIQFDWLSLEGATSYRIQIARPSFDNPEQFIFNEIQQDSLMPNTEFTLPTGTYQWRVKGINGAYESAYSTHNLIIN
jgi:hypothetical protein